MFLVAKMGKKNNQKKRPRKQRNERETPTEMTTSIHDLVGQLADFIRDDSETEIPTGRAALLETIKDCCEYTDSNINYISPSSTFKVGPYRNKRVKSLHQTSSN